jgi:hypothetical protein
VSTSFGAKTHQIVLFSVDIKSYFTTPNLYAIYCPLHLITDGTKKFPTDENNNIIRKALQKTVAAPQLIQQTIDHNISE